MPILKSDMPAINEGADKLSALLLGTIQRRQEAERQKQLDVQKAQELMSLETEQAVSKAQQLQPIEVKTQQDIHKAKIDADRAALDVLLRGRPGNSGAHVGSVGVSPPPVTGALLSDRQEARREKQEKEYGELMAKTAGYMDTFEQLEAATNRDGKGGIFTNPEAKLLSAGKFASKASDEVVALGEMIGTMPKGSAAERKLVSRLTQEYARSMAGLRASDKERELINAAMGRIVSDDPELVKKALIDLRGNLQSVIAKQEGGFQPEVVQAVKGRVEKIKPSQSSADIEAKRKRLAELEAKAKE